MKCLTLIILHCSWIPEPLLFIRNIQDYKMKKPKQKKGTAARDVATQSCSLYFHYTLCILKYFLSSIASLFFILVLHNPSLQDSITWTKAGASTHSTQQISYLCLSCSPQTAPWVPHTTLPFKCPYAVCHGKASEAFYPSSFVSTAPWSVFLSVPKSLWSLSS